MKNHQVFFVLASTYFPRQDAKYLRAPCELNFCVWYGNRWTVAINTNYMAPQVGYSPVSGNVTE